MKMTPLARLLLLFTGLLASYPVAVGIEGLSTVSMAMTFLFVVGFRLG